MLLPSPLPRPFSFRPGQDEERTRIILRNTRTCCSEPIPFAFLRTGALNEPEYPVSPLRAYV